MVYACDWYERQRKGLSAAFLLCVEEVLVRIGRTPELYTALYHDIHRALTRRFPYAVYYLGLPALKWSYWASCIRTEIRASGSYEPNIE